MMNPSSIFSEADRFFEALRRVGLVLHIPIDRSEIDFDGVENISDRPDSGQRLISVGKYAGIFIKEATLDVDDIVQALIEGYPVILLGPGDKLHVCESLHNSQVEISSFEGQVQVRLYKQNQLRDLLNSSGEIRMLVCKPELECQTLSAADPHGHSHNGHGHHVSMKPFRRFLALLRLDQRDVWTIALFALVAGILSLATPLAVDALVSVVSWGTFMQPLIVLSIMLLVCLSLAAFLEILQTVIVEIIQRRQLVRIVGDLSHRFPRANRSSLHGAHPRELANRVFDIMTIQKASAVLLLDGISIILTTLIGLVLLAFYHPFLMGFAIVLVISMISITWVLGRGGVNSAVDESITKYRIAHWLQDVIAAPSAFKVNGGEGLAIERSNRLVTDYLEARRVQFRVVLRQVAFAIGLQVIASTALLGLGGYLVISQQLTLGQLVASELVVAVVVGAFAKAGKSFEKFYDLMAGIDKVGHLLDIAVDARTETAPVVKEAAPVRWGELVFHDDATHAHKHVHANAIKSGGRVAVTGSDRHLIKCFIDSLAAVTQPIQGTAEVAQMSVEQAALSSNGRVVGYVTLEELFHGTILENVDLGRMDVTRNRVRESLQAVGLWESVLQHPKGIRAMLQSGGAPLSDAEQALLLVARGIANKPRLLVIDSVLDQLPDHMLRNVLQMLIEEKGWTLVIATNNQTVLEVCDQRLEMNLSTDHNQDTSHE